MKNAKKTSIQANLMSPLQKFFQFAPRENSGSTTASRYDYQNHWALCKLLNLHSQSSNYLLVLEYHDDLVVFDDEEQPTKADFFQIKTRKSGAWSVSKLLERKDQQSLSMIGKLYDHKIKFEEEVSSLNLVSNARFKLFLKKAERSSENQDQICMLELSDEIIKKFKEAVQQEHHLKVEPVFEDMTFFVFSDLSLNDFEAHTKGKLLEFLEKMLPGKKVSGVEVYKSLIAEINRKTNVSAKLNNLEEARKLKSIGRKYFHNMLKVIEDVSEDRWARIETRLNS